jgi:hypothetical protein
MKYAVEMSSTDMIYTPSFINIGSTTEKLLGGYTHRQQDNLTSLPLYFHNKRLNKFVQRYCTYLPINTDLDYVTLETKSIVVGTSLLIADTE